MYRKTFFSSLHVYALARTVFRYRLRRVCFCLCWLGGDKFRFGHTTYPPGHFDAIWSSPCCTNYSCARRGAKTPRNLPLADSLVLRSQEIINYFNPRVWFIENPQTGLLKDRRFMHSIPFSDVDYCCYCDWGYRKRTRLWNNVNFTGKLCLGKDSCPNMENGKHTTTAQQGRNRCKTGLYGTHFSQTTLHKIPPLLCEAIEARSRMEIDGGALSP